MAYRLFDLTLLALFLLALATCAGRSTDALHLQQDQAGALHNAAPVDGSALDAPGGLARLDGLPAPKGVDARLWAQLKAELSRVAALRAAGGDARATTAAPGAPGGEVTDFMVNTAGAYWAGFRWTYANRGDYDQNGDVNISDLTPIGLHFGAREGDANWTAAQVADGDANGEVNIADITPLGMNLGHNMQGYMLEGSADGLPESDWTEVQTLGMWAGPVPGNGGARLFEYKLDPAVNGLFYRVRPFEGSGVNRTLGAPSNPARFLWLIPPAALTASDGDLPHSVHLAWAQVPGVAGYALYRDGQAESERVATLDAEAFSYEDVPPDYGPHEYWVRADYGFILGPFSDPDTGYMSGERGDWYMFGRDPRHTKRSPYKGPASLSIKWRFPVPAQIHSSPAVGYDGTVYVGCDNGQLYAVAPDGTERWEYYVNSLYNSPAIGPDGTIYIGAAEGYKMYALHPDGSLYWDYTLNASRICTPGMGYDGTVYAAVQFAGLLSELYAFAPDGEVKWHTSLHTDAPEVRLGLASPAVSKEGRIYVTGWNGLHCFSADGEQLWYCPVWYPEDCTPVIRDDGSVAIITVTSEIAVPQITIISTSGEIVWRTPWPGIDFYIASSPALLFDDGLVVFASNGSLISLSTDGSVEWSIDGPGINGIKVLSPIVASDSSIFHAARVDASAHGFGRTLANGTDFQPLDAGGHCWGCPAISNDRTIYVGTDNNELLAIGN